MLSKEVVKSLKIPGYELDTETIVEMDTVIYNKKDDEDDWIKIIPDSHLSDVYVIIFVHDCVDVKCTIFNPAIYVSDTWKELLEKVIKNDMPSKMK